MCVCIPCISIAGVTWTNRTTSAPWDARYGHTSVIDAAGAIYVIGGTMDLSRDDTYLNDVWVSTDGGARPDSVGGEGSGGAGRVLRGTRGYHNVLSATWATQKVLEGYVQGTTGLLEGYYKGTRGVPTGCSRGALRAFPWPGSDLQY
jgi:hypothetical protein